MMKMREQERKKPAIIETKIFLWFLSAYNLLWLSEGFATLAISTADEGYKAEVCHLGVFETR